MSEKQIDYTDKILDIIFAINSESDYYSLLNVILAKMRDITHCDAGTLYVLEDSQLHFKIMQNDSLGIYKRTDDEVNLPPIELNEQNIQNVSAYSALKNEFINIADVYENTEYNFQGPKDYDKLTGYRTCSMLVFPLANLENEVVGVLQLINSFDVQTKAVIPFDTEMHTILKSISSIAAVVLTNIKYTVEIKEQFYSFVKIMSAAIDERTPYNANHTKMVAKYADLFTDFLNSKFNPGDAFYFGKNRKEQLIMAAFLHDIGKSVTPIHVMNKPTRLGDKLDVVCFRFDIKKLQLEVDCHNGVITREKCDGMVDELEEAYRFIVRANSSPFLCDEELEVVNAIGRYTYVDREGDTVPLLDKDDLESLNVQKGTLTEKEFKIMKNHVVVTGKLLSNISFNRYYKNVPEWAEKHHEYLDGTGYPNGYDADYLPIEVCILTMLDIFDALVARDRPYKNAMPPQNALKILAQMADEGKLHKKLVELFTESGIGV